MSTRTTASPTASAVRNQNLALPAAGLSDSAFTRLTTFIDRETGIQLPSTKRMTLENRLQRRIRELNLESFADYERYFFAHLDAERTPLIDAVTTNKTDFFREPSHFDYLLRHVVPLWSGPGPFRLWSAACSSGEEPYTLAMLLAEFEREHARPFPHSILATDISSRMLEEARLAIYPKSRIAQVPLHLRQRYLREGTGSKSGMVRIDAKLRARIRFQPLNLMAADYHIGDACQAIFCRNVMIYFNRATQQEVVLRLCRCLRPGGYLFIGHSESLLELDVPFSIVKPSVYRKWE